MNDVAVIAATPALARSGAAALPAVAAPAPIPGWNARRQLHAIVISIVTVIATSMLACEPAAAQVAAGVRLTTPPGPVAACPTQLAFTATFNYTLDWLRDSNKQIQYKWIDSAGNSYESVTLTIPTLAIVSKQLFATVQQTFNWHGAGTNWIALQISYPINATSNKVNFQLTCPTPGSLKEL